MIASVFPHISSAGLTRAPTQKKPEHLVEQTFYILLIPQNEVVAALAPGAFFAGAPENFTAGAAGADRRRGWGRLTH